MLVFKEGVPGAGKSYDALVTDILPALAAKRKVYARLNGLDHAKIASHLSMPLSEVQQLLVLLDDDAVKDIWKPGAVDADSLVVIDEAHKYYEASREAINKRVEEFYAEHRHAGLDVVMLSQWYRRLHSAIRARIERKAVFQKLTAVGSEKSYRVTFFHATGPDRFEKVSGETHRYDKAIFPLYHGVKPDTKNTAVYRAGGKTVWAKIGFYAVFVVPLVILAVWVLSSFFHGNGGVAKSSVGKHVDVAPMSVVVRPERPSEVAASMKATGVPDFHRSAYDTSKMTPEAAYLFDLAEQAKPRLAGFAQVKDGKAYGVIEWRQDQGRVVERLTIEQVRALGVQVDVEPFGVRLSAGKAVVIVTAWPVDVPDGTPAGEPTPVAPSSVPVVASAGVLGGQAHPWERGVGGGSYTPPELTSVSSIGQ
jgi:zona occludens toxin